MQKVNFENFENKFWKQKDAVCEYVLRGSCRVSKDQCPKLHPGDIYYCRYAMHPEHKIDKCNREDCTGLHMIDEVNRIWNTHYENAKIILSSMYKMHYDNAEKVKNSIIIISKPIFFHLNSFIVKHIQKIRGPNQTKSVLDLITEFFGMIKPEISRNNQPDSLARNEPNIIKVKPCKAQNCIRETCTYSHRASESRCNFFESCSRSYCSRIHQGVYQEITKKITDLVEVKDFEKVILTIDDFLKDKKAKFAYIFELSDFLWNLLEKKGITDFKISQKIFNLLDEAKSSIYSTDKNEKIMLEEFQKTTNMNIKKIKDIIINSHFGEIKQEQIKKELAKELFDKKQFDEVAKCLIEQKENGFLKNYYLACSLFMKENNKDMKTIIAELEHIKLPLSYLMLSRIYFEDLYEKKTALEYLNKFMEVIVDNSFAFFLKGQILRSQEEYDQAILAFKTAQDIDNNIELRLSFEIGKTLLEKAKSENSDELYEKAWSQLKIAFDAKPDTEIKTCCLEVYEKIKSKVSEAGSLTLNRSNMTSTASPDILRESVSITEKIEKLDNFVTIMREIRTEGNSIRYSGLYKSIPSIIKVVQSYEEFQTEYKILQFSNHPNILDAYHPILKNKHHYIALEYYEGTLEELINSKQSKFLELKNSLSISKKTRIMKKLLKGLYYLHQKSPIKCIHRNLRPESIMISKDGVPKISEFENAKIKTEVNIKFGLNSIQVHSEWRPPVSFDDLKENDDVFSLGCIFFFLHYDGLHLFGDGKKKYYANPKLCELDCKMIKTNIQSNSSQIESIKNPEFKNLIFLMTSRDSKHDLDIYEYLNHPYFWKEKKKVEFLMRIGAKNEEINANDMKYSKWKDYFDHRILQEFQLLDYKDTFFGLLYAFYKLNQPENITRFLNGYAQILNQKIMSVLQFFSFRFPEFIIDAFSTIEDNKGKTEFHSNLQRKIWYRD